MNTPDTYYYRNNFFELINNVFTRYSTLLDDAEQAWYHQLSNVDFYDQCLYVRLLSRKTTGVRVDKLSYIELPDIQVSIQRLFDAGLVLFDSDLDDQEWLGFLTLPELKKQISHPLDIKPKKRQEWLNAVLDAGDLASIRIQFPTIRIPSIAHQFMTRFCYMFFGNRHQSLTDFILSDLGIRNYPQWPPLSRYFKTRAQVDAHLSLADTFRLLDESERALTVTELTDLLEHRNEAEDPIYRRRQSRLQYKIARQIERLGALEQAYQLYPKDIELAQQRRVRIAVKLNSLQEAELLFDDLTLRTDSDSCVDFVRRFKPTFEKAMGRHSQRIKPYQPNEAKQTIRRRDGSVEAATIEYFKECGATAFFVENRLINTLFSCVLWPAICADVPGAFFNPFQTGPSDLFSSSFAEVRADLIENRWQELDSTEDWRNIILQTYADIGNLNVFGLYGHSLADGIFAKWLNSLTYPQIKGLIDYLLADLSSRRKGQPDLIVFDGNETFFVEVKGPGDQLQDHQRLWFQTFEQLGVAAKVMWIEYE